MAAWASSRSRSTNASVLPHLRPRFDPVHDLHPGAGVAAGRVQVVRASTTLCRVMVQMLRDGRGAVPAAGRVLLRTRRAAADTFQWDALLGASLFSCAAALRVLRVQGVALRHAGRATSSRGAAATRVSAASRGIRRICWRSPD